METKTILVTGGAGFIGSHLCEYLLSRGHSVICMDNFFTGQKRNVAHLLGHPDFEVIRHDITHKFHVHCEQIYNLACPASPVHYQFNPIKTILTSTVGMINVLEVARQAGARILQASTSEVYGDPKVHPQPESYFGNVNSIGPRSCYDEGKRVAETLCMDYHRQEEVDVRISRIFNTYGTRMAVGDGRVISNFIVQALKNHEITVYGDGKQTRSFCYVADLVAGLYKLMNKEGFLDPVNLGNPEEFTILELAQKVVELTNSEAKLVFRNLPADDPMQRRPDITVAKQVLGWEPKIQLEEGLGYTIEYFRGVLNKKM
ncbi:MAG TPA: UDP-glucuronic acid decarboxylase family protein [Candidatus Nanoarchaeia archaeon]|nr:UDP-glucuronic acid decarboxylase family protein [Candidatus Nanoarchaeia archaeon]